MSTHDLRPATRNLAAVLTAIDDRQLSAPTPCDVELAGLLHHLDGLSQAFAAAARKDHGPATQTQASADPSELDPRWRETLPIRLDELAAAWDEPGAWEGITAAGGVDLPSQLAGVIALDEVVLHGWDVSRAVGQRFSVRDEDVAACMEFVAQSAPPERAAQRRGLFGPARPVPEGATPLDRLVALSGRDPSWTAGAQQ
jgi:uncharacterized protein (TIGR03086 family)